MNETIGVKGGRRDRKRTITITSENKRKLKQYYKEKKKLKLEKLEKDVKNLQLASFLVAMPISIAGNTFQTIFQNSNYLNQEREQAKGLEIEQLHQAEKLELSESSLYIEDYQLNDRKFTDYGYPKTIDGKQIIPTTKKIKEPKNIVVTTAPTIAKTKQSLKENEKNYNQIDDSLSSNINKEKQKEQVTSNKHQVNVEKEISLESNIIFQKATDKKIISEYESKLKDIKQELKKVIYEYNVLSKNSEEFYTSKEAEKMLYQLSIIIKKMEELKERIKVEITNLESENYLINLVDNYLESFKNKTIVDEVKDSNLYIMIAEKLAEVEDKTEKLNNKVEDKKEKLEIDEEKLEKLKDAYYDYNNFNNQLISFQNDQTFLLKDLEEKVKQSTTITEEVEYKMQIMTKQSKKLLNMIALPAMIPGNRSARAIASATAAYLYFLKNLINPQLQQKRHRIILVTDYSKEIETNILKVEDALNLISKTTKKLENMINKIEIDFKDYLNEIPECKELLANLNQLLSNMKEKEEELEKTKAQQEKLLDKNNQKVKTLNKVEEV